MFSVAGTTFEFEVRKLSLAEATTASAIDFQPATRQEDRGKLDLGIRIRIQIYQD
jgi:hypothetical protein